MNSTNRPKVAFIGIGGTMSSLGVHPLELKDYGVQENRMHASEIVAQLPADFRNEPAIRIYASRHRRGQCGLCPLVRSPSEPDPPNLIRDRFFFAQSFAKRYMVPSDAGLFELEFDPCLVEVRILGSCSMEKILSEAHLAKTYAVTVNGEERRIGSSFYRGDVANYYPMRSNMRTPEAISEWILKGWMPEQPFIDRSANIVAFGSCFAANIGRYLSSIGYDVSTQREGSTYIQRISDGLVNVHAICQQFEWAWENRVPPVELWHGWKAEEFGYDEQVRLETRKLFDVADVFILTFGLSEIWYDEPTGEVFWRAVPADKFDASRHKFRVATIEETMERLRRIHALIRTHRPQAKIVFTLSPIALTATFRSVSCMTASTASKALLRAAIDQLHREVQPNDSDFFYFPSYEVVMLGFREPFTRDLRHPAAHVLNCNMKAFERYFCSTGLTDADLQAVMADALELDELLVVASDEERDALLLDQSAEWKTRRSRTKDVEKQMIVRERAAIAQERLQAREADRVAKREARDELRKKRVAAREASHSRSRPS